MPPWVQPLDRRRARVVAACDGCGEYFTGEPHQVIEAICALCGEGLRPCSPEEALAYVDRLEREGSLPPDGPAGEEEPR
jgi:hypothetical protein